MHHAAQSTVLSSGCPSVRPSVTFTYIVLVYNYVGQVIWKVIVLYEYCRSLRSSDCSIYEAEHYRKSFY